MKRINFEQDEIAVHDDFAAMGEFAQDHVDKVVLDTIGYPAHWAAFTTAQKSTVEVTVSPGRYYKGEMVYQQEGSKDLDLTLHVPVAASDQRWVAILLRGEEVQVEETRSFETATDVDTSTLVDRSTPKRIERRVNLIVQPGDANPVPIKPAIAETDACIAFVLITATGIDSIEPGNDSRVKSLHEVNDRVTALEVDLEGLFLRTETIETQITNIKGQLDEIPRPPIIQQMQRDIATARIRLDLPGNARAYHFDPALLPDLWDMEHVDWLARVDEGIRFGYASTVQSRLELQAEDDPEVKSKRRRFTPYFDEVTRIANTSRDTSLNISQLVHSLTTMVRKEVSKSRIVYGPTERTCENRSQWARYDNSLQVGQTYVVDGETFLVVDQRSDKPHWPGHDHFGIRQVRIDNYTETYWKHQTEQVGVNGSTYAQTFLAAQPMVMTSLEVAFARVGAEGDVHFAIVETSRNGAPVLDDALVTKTLFHEDIKSGWNRLDLPLTLLESGRRYAFVVVTTGAHALHCSSENKYTGGSRFISTDGEFSQASVDEDFCFRVNAARYRKVRTVVPMTPLNLADGMTSIDLVYPGWKPAGCELGWEIRPQGQENWRELDDGDPALNPLNGLPANVELRMVMMGTPDLQPMIELTPYAVSRVNRNRGDMVAVSKNLQFGVTTTEIQTVFVVDGFDPERHTFTPRIIAGGAVVDADSTSVEVDPDNALRRTYRSTFTLGTGVESARMRPEGDTSNVASSFFIESAFMAAL